MQSGGDREVLQLGRQRAATDPVRFWARQHPRPVRATVAVLAVAVTVVGAIGLIRYLRGPASPRLAYASAPAKMQDLVGGWGVGADGRPREPAMLRLRAQLRFDRLPSGGVELLGISGPGVVSRTPRPVRIDAAGVTTQVELSGTVDCTAARIPSAPGDYRLLARVRDGSRRFTRELAPAGLTGPLSSQVNAVCGSWLAGHDLTVTAATTRVDPVRAAVDVTLSVTNTGPRRHYLSLLPPQGFLLRLTDPADTVLPAGPGRTQLGVHLELQSCDAVTTPWGPFEVGQLGATSANALPANSADLLGIEASAVRTAAGPQPPMPADGLGPTGILTVPAAAQALVAALRTVCGELGQVVTLIDDAKVRYDRATRRLDLAVQILLTPGRARDLTLFRIASAAEGNTFTPLWSRSPTLIPDRSGQVEISLPYRAPTALGCSADNSGASAWVPWFAIEVRVAVPSGTRTVRLSQQGMPDLDPHVASLLCR